MKQSPEQIVDELIGKAKKAQLLFEKLPQEKIDEIVTGVAWALCKPSNNEKISDQAVKDTGLGNASDKVLKNRRKTLGLLRDIKNVKTIGVIKEDDN
jgi:sulfoacetaldehyde dehydrogenase